MGTGENVVCRLNCQQDYIYTNSSICTKGFGDSYMARRNGIYRTSENYPSRQKASFLK